MARPGLPASLSAAEDRDMDMRSRKARIVVLRGGHGAIAIRKVKAERPEMVGG